MSLPKKGSLLLAATFRFSKLVHYKSTNSDLFDIVICGGGMVGLACGLALSRNSHLSRQRVLLLERSMLSRGISENLSLEFTNRVSALSPSSVNLLSDLDVWPLIVEKSCAIRKMRVWDGLSHSAISFAGSNKELERLAYVVENSVITGALLDCLSGSNVEILDDVGNVKISHREQGNQKISVQLQCGRNIITSLLIGADGMNSTVRKFMNVPTVFKDYHQKAIVATLAHQENVIDTAWQRFLPSGPVALLPLSSTRSSLVWTTQTTHANALLRLSDEEFVERVNFAFLAELPRSKLFTLYSSALHSWLKWLSSSHASDSFSYCTPPHIDAICAGSRAAFPLSLHHSCQYVTERLVLIGDAAHRVHPMAGQGVNLGFGDVEDLCQVLSTAVKCGADIGSLHHLCDYESRRQRAAASMLLVTDFLHRLYSSTCFPSVLARSFGIQMCDSLDVVKRLIISKAVS